MKGWKTLLFAIAVAVIGALEAFDFTQVVPESAQGWALMVIGVIVALLRKATTTALGKSE